MQGTSPPIQSAGAVSLYDADMQDQASQPPGGYTEDDHPFASRGGLKLDCALQVSGIDVTGLMAADLGCSTGGFTSCLLHRGAARVYAVDTGYGVLDYKLRQDERVVVMERSNALHVEPPAEVASATGQHAADQPTGVDLVVIDLGWTKQDKALAAAVKWLRPGGRVITLIKPHYEQPRDTPTRRGKGKTKPEPMDEDQARQVAGQTLEAIHSDATLGLTVLGSCDSPIRGKKGGNLEVLGWLVYDRPA